MGITSESGAAHQFLANAAAALELEVVSYCDELNIKKSPPRYFHANVRRSRVSSATLRLKVVNPDHPDYAGTCNCCRYSNHVHRTLVRSEGLQGIIDIPAYWEVPPNRENTANCSEFVEGRAPTADDLPLVVDTLVRLTLHRARITNELAQPKFLASSSLNWYGYQEYRGRLCFSLQGLLEAQAISARLADKVRDTFGQCMKVWPHRGQLTFVHGDFSYGNFRLRGDKLVLLDFEHSHIGVGAIDLAHHYVNLAVQQEAGQAERLLHLMTQRCDHAGVEFSRETVHAAVLERVTGKMNSMSDTRGEKWEKLVTLLVAYTEGTG
jgi:hypothetical protein